MSEYLFVFVPGKPAPQGSKRALGPGVMIESSKYVKPWRADIREAVRTEWERYGPGGVVDEPLTVELMFRMPRPASTPKSYTPYAIKRPDVDKLVRAVLDAISSAGVWADDSRVVELYASKCLAEADEPPGVSIRVRPCTSAFLGEEAKR